MDLMIIVLIHNNKYMNLMKTSLFNENSYGFINQFAHNVNVI